MTGREVWKSWRKLEKDECKSTDGALAYHPLSYFLNYWPKPLLGCDPFEPNYPPTADHASLLVPDNFRLVILGTLAYMSAVRHAHSIWGG
jgi:hypothetical protein